MSPALPTAAPRKKPVNPRHRARQFVLQGLYQSLVGDQDQAAILAQAVGVEGFDKIDRELYQTLLAKTLGEADALQQELSPFLDRPWTAVSPIERGILLLGACEFAHFPQTPYRVVLNEAIELARSYGGTDGHRFVNGILDKLAAKLRPEEARRTP